ncbi:hypothetical protein [Microbulbifer sp. ALW1]|uniref:hypothetical protein n=1 Tax=Microbulbifer sp. (strain ALW1) TaxID=1516059 RepID=UPI00135BCD3F|nr:hypothetical protein [Microbulbifer sp. ALW1]
MGFTHPPSLFSVYDELDRSGRFNAAPSAHAQFIVAPKMLAQMCESTDILGARAGLRPRRHLFVMHVPQMLFFNFRWMMQYD